MGYLDYIFSLEKDEKTPWWVYTIISLLIGTILLIIFYVTRIYALLGFVGLAYCSAILSPIFFSDC